MIGSSSVAVQSVAFATQEVLACVSADLTELK